MFSRKLCLPFHRSLYLNGPVRNDRSSPRILPRLTVSVLPLGPRQTARTGQLLRFNASVFVVWGCFLIQESAQKQMDSKLLSRTGWTDPQFFRRHTITIHTRFCIFILNSPYFSRPESVEVAAFKQWSTDYETPNSHRIIKNEHPELFTSRNHVP